MHNVSCRDSKGQNNWYEPISIVEHAGSLSDFDSSSGHYTCFIKEKTTKMWFRTNDGQYTVQISANDVTKMAYVVLYRKIDD